MLKLDLKKEIGELGALVIALIIGFVASSFWIGLISFVVLELVYLLVYDAIAKKAEAQKPKEEKEEINFHEYDDDTESDNAQQAQKIKGRNYYEVLHWY